MTPENEETIISIRFPTELLDKIRIRAKENMRSINSEVIFILKKEAEK